MENRVVKIAGAMALAAGLAAAQSSVAFEVVSVKPAGAVPSGDGRGSDGPGGMGRGCDGNAPRFDGSHFVVTTTPYALITWAYGYNKTWGCSWAAFGDLLTGGPDWIRSQRFEVQAVVPKGAPVYTFEQFMHGDATELEKMLETMLAERFKLVVHHETKEVAAYALVPAKGGAKFTRPTDADKPGLGIRRVNGANGPSQHVIGRKVEMRDLAFLLVMTTHRPVIDRSGVTGQINFDLEFAPFDGDPGAESSAPSLFTAIQQQLGLRMDNTKAPLEGLVVDHAELPTGN